MAIHHHHQQQQLTSLIQNAALQSTSWITPALGLSHSRDSVSRAADFNKNSTTTPGPQISTFENHFGLSVTNDATLPSLGTAPFMSSFGLPVRNFSLERLTAADDTRFLYLSDRFPTDTTVTPFALYAHFSKCSYLLISCPTI